MKRVDPEGTKHIYAGKTFKSKKSTGLEGEVSVRPIRVSQVTHLFGRSDANQVKSRIKGTDLRVVFCCSRNLSHLPTVRNSCNVNTDPLILSLKNFYIWLKRGFESFESR